MTSCVCYNYADEVWVGLIQFFSHARFSDIQTEFKTFFLFAVIKGHSFQYIYSLKYLLNDPH